MEHGHSHTRRIGWTILLNVIITVAEYFGGIFSGSLALLSDAGHNFSDVLSLVLGYLGEKASKVRPNKRHSFGFKRTEIFTALINALALWVISLLIITEAIKRISNPQPITLSLMIGIGTIGLLGNLVSVIILNRDRNKSLNMKAAYLHLFYDTISSVAVIISAIIIFFTHFLLLDLIVSILIAIMIFFSALEIIRKSIHIFMQGVPEGVDIDELIKDINKVDGVLSSHKIHIWSINSNEAFFSAHLCIDNGVENTDELIKTVNKLLKEKYSIENTATQIENENICKLE